MKKRKNIWKEAGILLILATLVFSSAIEAINIPGKSSKMNENIQIEITDIPSTGLAPVNKDSALSIAKNALGMDSWNNGNKMTLSPGPTMYGYVVTGSLTAGPCSFDVDVPGTIHHLSDDQVPSFASGGVWTCDGEWLVCGYENGALYEIENPTDPPNCHLTTIGGGGVGLNALACNPTNNECYGASETALYWINPETGEQDPRGPFGDDVLYMIGMSFDEDGTLYGWDIGDKLWTINTENGDADLVAPLMVGEDALNLNYAQDGDFYYGTDTLYLAAYTLAPSYGGYLYTCDEDTGACTLVGALGDGSNEIDGTMFMSACVPPEHDVGVESIELSVDGCVGGPVPIEVTIENYGTNDKVTDVQIVISKFDAVPTTLLTQDFTTWPTDWEYNGYESSPTANAGGTAPEAYYGYTSYTSFGYLMTPTINANSYGKVNVKFRLYGDFSDYYESFFYLQHRKNAASPWNTVYPWDNPVPDPLGPDYYEVDCYGDIGCWGEDLGDEFQVRWYFGSYYYYLQYGSGIYIDDVIIEGYNIIDEYAAIATDKDVPAGTSVVVDDFIPPWTPSGCDEEYYVTAHTRLDDDNPENDCKTMDLILECCCFEIVDIYLDYTGGSDKCENVCVKIKNNCDYDINDIELTMDFYINPPNCPCGGLGFLTDPIEITPNVHYRYTWSGNLQAWPGPNSERTKCTKVKGFAYFDLVVTLSSLSEDCCVTETRSGFVGLQLY